MELKQLLAIFRKDILFFVSFVLVVVVGALVWQKNQDVTYEATLLLNIGRTGAEQTAEYTYDSFYRLQADERFADTIVRWLTSPRVVEDIYKEAHLNTESSSLKDLKKAFGASRLSSQMIEVAYGGTNEKTLEQLSKATITVLGRYTEELNKEDQAKSWFVVIGSEPVIRDARIPASTTFTVGMAVGLFLGFWLVVFRYYLKED